MKRTTKSILSFLFALAMLMSFVPVSAFATTTPTAAATDATATVAPTGAAGGAVTYSGTYHAYMGFQTNTKLWIFRNAYDDKTYGFGTDEFTHGLVYIDNKTKKTVQVNGTFTDVEVDGDGTYTVKLDNPDLQTETSMSQLFVSTDIPMSDAIKVSNVIVKFNDTTAYTFPEGILNPESKKYAQIMCQNIWNKTVTDLFSYTLPFTSASITFTISGMGYESKTANATPTVAAAATTAPAADASADADSSNGGLNTGVIIGIVAAAVVVVIIIIVAVSRKKK